MRREKPQSGSIPGLQMDLKFQTESFLWFANSSAWNKPTLNLDIRTVHSSLLLGGGTHRAKILKRCGLTLWGETRTMLWFSSIMYKLHVMHSHNFWSRLEHIKVTFGYQNKLQWKLSAVCWLNPGQILVLLPKNQKFTTVNMESACSWCYQIPRCHQNAFAAGMSPSG